MNTRMPSVVTALALGVLLVGTPACGHGGGEDALPAWTAPYARSGPPPEGAQLVSREVFLRRVEEGSLTLLHPDQPSRDLADLQTRLTANRARAEFLLADHLDLLDRHTGARPDLEDPGFELSPDGSWVAPSGIVFQGDVWAYGEIADAITRYRDVENQREVYAALHALLDRDLVDRLSLPAPSVVAGFDFQRVVDLIDTVSGNWPDFGGIFAPPPGYPSSWMGEEGSASIRGDAADLSTPSGPAGLPIYPLRWCVTSVKSQGRRGSCVAFAATAAIEILVAKTRGRWVNLSEQMLYNRAKQAWWPSSYGDSLNTAATLQTMLISGFRYPFESSWDYNRSPFRIDLGSAYVLSCQATDTGAVYQGEQCSDLNHQADVVCISQGGYTYCGVADPTNTIAADAGFGLAGYQVIHEPGMVGLATAKAFLALGRPVILSVTVPSVSMDDALLETTGGYAPWLGDIESTLGGHSMCLVGYVTNAQLPAGAPPGSGGGYFLCKNSWGSDYGDAGYVYLPDDWVLTWSRALFLLGDDVVGP